LPDGRVREEIAVGANEKIMLSLEVDAVTAKVSSVDIPYVYTLKNGSRVQQQHTGSLKVQASQGPDQTDKATGTVLIEKRFPILRLDEDQETATLEIDLQNSSNEWVLVGARAGIRLDPPYFAMSFVKAIVVWTLGTVLVLIGAIQWARGVAAVPAPLAQTNAETRHERFWCMCCHLGALLGYILPFGHILAPLVIWITKRRQVPGVDEAGRESLNFQLTVTLFALIGIMLSTVVIGLFMLFVLVAFHFSLTLFAALRAQRGEQVRYPVNFRIISPSG